jgi:hypothetical protein
MAFTRLSVISGFSVAACAAVCAMTLAGCGSNDAAVTADPSMGYPIAGGSAAGATGAPVAKAGAGGMVAAAAGAKTGSAGVTASTTPATSGVAGSTTGIAGTVDVAGGEAGAAAGAGEVAGSSGGTAGSGSTGTYSPACADTVAKGGACTTEGEVCYKTCGPVKTGFKAETCTSGNITEGSCEFSAGADYSCYKIPATIDAAACPTTAPTANTECTVAACVVCNVGGKYLDSKGYEKTGYCVCPEGGTSRKWSCASDTAWPCPAGSGC